MSGTPVLACAVCRDWNVGQHNWFLLAQDQWLDRLRVFAWDRTVAQQAGVYCACTPQHVQEMVARWMVTARLVPVSRQSATCLAEGEEARFEGSMRPVTANLDGLSLLGELSVDRQSLARVLNEDPQLLISTLESLVKALQGERGAQAHRPPTHESIEVPTAPLLV